MGKARLICHEYAMEAEEEPASLFTATLNLLI